MKKETKRGSPPGSNRGGGKPPLGPHRPIKINLPAEMLGEVDQARGDTPRGVWIREAISARLDTTPDTNKS